MSTYADEGDGGDWVNINNPLDSEIELSAEGGEHDILLEYVRR